MDSTPPSGSWPHSSSYASAECAAGWLLWGGHRSGAVLALAILPFAGVFWWGFALPFGPVFALPEIALILLNWRSLR